MWKVLYKLKLKILRLFKSKYNELALLKNKYSETHLIGHLTCIQKKTPFYDKTSLTVGLKCVKSKIKFCVACLIYNQIHVQWKYEIWNQIIENPFSLCTGRQWMYQTCTEFGFFQSSDLGDVQPFGNFFSLQ